MAKYWYFSKNVRVTPYLKNLISHNIHRVFLNSLGRIMIDSEIVEVSALESRLKKLSKNKVLWGTAINFWCSF